MRSRLNDSLRDNTPQRKVAPDHSATDRTFDNNVEGAAFSEQQQKMLRMQGRHGNQYVLRMVARGAFPGARVQRDDDDSEEQAPDASNSMIGDAANFVGDLLGVKGIPGKVKQGVDKAQQGVNEGIDWTLDKVGRGARKVGEWLEE